MCSQTGETVVFEAFEASPLSEKVLSSENALQWEFPGSAIAVPYPEFFKETFQEALSNFLEHASFESIKQFAAITTKAQSKVYECRDTCNPDLISQLLMTMLEVNGHRVHPPKLRKRIRDDACYSEGARYPWRRSPM